jgi:hypothetical protein
MNRYDPNWSEGVQDMQSSEYGEYVLFEDADAERVIVDRIWDILGRPTYAELNGRSIFDLVQGYKMAAEGYRRDHSLSCTTDGVNENRCHWCKLVDANPSAGKGMITPHQSGWDGVDDMLHHLRSDKNGL